MTQDEYRARCEYKRDKHVVTDLKTGKKVSDFQSINEAKRWVRENARFTTYRV